MSSELFETLRDGREAVSSGEFTLNRKKAREKLAKFQLPRPHDYVLEFVQAAHLLEATEIEVEVDSDEMTMTFDGEALTRAQLSELYRAGFASGTSPSLEALRHFAIAVTTAWELDPAEFRIDVDDGTSRFVVELSEFGSDEISDRETSEVERTRIYLRERKRLSHLFEFVRALGGEFEEEAILKRRCRMSEIPIRINGVDSTQGFELPGRVEYVAEIDNGYERGRIGIVPSAPREDSGISIATHGVRMKTLQGHAFPFAIYGVIDSSRLRKGLSQQQLVQDEAFDAIRHEVLPEAVFRATAKMLESSSPSDIAEHAGALRQLADLAWGMEDHASGILGGGLSAFQTAVRDAPIWRLAFDARANAPSDPISIRGLDELYAEASIPFSRVQFTHERPVELPTTVLFDRESRVVLNDVFGYRLRDKTRDVQTEMDRARLLTELRARGRPVEPAADDFLTRRVIERGDVRAVVGVPRMIDSPHLKTSFAVTNSELILHRDRQNLDLERVAVWFNGELGLRLQKPHFVASDAYIAAAKAVLRELPKLLADAIDQVGRRSVTSWLTAITSGYTPVRSAELLGIPEDTIGVLIDELLAGNAVPRWQDLDEPARPSDPDVVATRLDALGAFAEAEIFELGAQYRVNLRRLEHLYNEHGRLVVGAKDNPHPTNSLALTGEPREIALVERVFGALYDPVEETQIQMLAHLDELYGDPDSDADSRPSPQVAASPAPEAGLSVFMSDDPPATNAPRLEPEDTKADAKPPTEDPVKKARRALAEEVRRAIDHAANEARNVSVEWMNETDSVAYLSGSDLILDATHSMIQPALEDPASSESLDWAMTAIFSAIAARDRRSDREIALTVLSELLATPSAANA